MDAEDAARPDDESSQATWDALRRHAITSLEASRDALEPMTAWAPHGDEAAVLRDLVDWIVQRLNDL